MCPLCQMPFPPRHQPCRVCGAAGLGYYRRAGYLLDGARHVVNNCGGVFPSTARELQRIPGTPP